MPKVSVIIPTYNRSQYISESIESVVSQSYPDWELIVVDDHSTDNTRDIVNKLIVENPERRIKCVMNTSYKGVSGARNTGVWEASGDYIAFLDSDDKWREDKLSKQMEVFEKFEAVDAVLCGAEYFGVVERGYGRAEYVKGLFEDKYWERVSDVVLIARWNLIFYLLNLGSPLRVQSMILKKECLERTGVFDEEMDYYEDAAFIFKFFITCKVAYYNEPLCQVRRHELNTDNILDASMKEDRDLKLVKNIYDFNSRLNDDRLPRKEFDRALHRAYVRNATYSFKRKKYQDAAGALEQSLRLCFSFKAFSRYLALRGINILKKFG